MSVVRRTISKEPLFSHFICCSRKKKSCGTCTRRRKKTVYDFGVIALKGVNFNWPFISIIVGFRARISERRSQSRFRVARPNADSRTRENAADLLNRGRRILMDRRPRTRASGGWRDGRLREAAGGSRPTSDLATLCE